MGVLINLFLLFSVTQYKVEQKHPCLLSTDNLKIKSKIELAIGCSKVRGERVFSRNRLKKIYEEGLIKE